MKTITLTGRYGPSAELTQIADNRWKLKSIDTLCRYGVEGDKLIFVDPGGGPFICIGTELEIGTVKSIESIGNETHLIL
jgi:hypothetical protein